MTVLFVAALEGEIRALQRRLESRSRVPGLAAYTGCLDKRPAIVAWTGDGPTRARFGLTHLLSKLRPKEIVVLGLAGGLSPDLEVGALTYVERLATRSCELGVPQGVQARPVTLCPSETMVLNPEQKNALWRRWGSPKPAVVDLESDVYIELAQQQGIPIRVLKVVSDACDEYLPDFFASAVGGDGSIQISKVVAFAALQPRSWPKLRSLQRTLKTASDRLATAAQEIVWGV